MRLDQVQGLAKRKSLWFLRVVSSGRYVSYNDNDSLTYQWFLFAEYNPRPKQLFLEDQLYTFYEH